MKMILIILLLFMFGKATAPNINEFTIKGNEGLTDPLLVLWDHVKYVETRDQDLINYDEKAYGRGQITPVKLREYNKANKTRYVLKDCLKEPVSLKIFLWHCRQYPSDEMIAKRWNGSGNATIRYWNKVQTLPLLEFRLRLYKLKPRTNDYISIMDNDFSYYHSGLLLCQVNK